MARANVHWQCCTKVGEAGQDLAADRTAVRAMRGICRENRLRRVALVEMLCDRPRPPRRGVAVVETGDEVGRGEEQQLGSRRLVVDSDGGDVDVDAREPHSSQPRSDHDP